MQRFSVFGAWGSVARGLLGIVFAFHAAAGVAQVIGTWQGVLQGDDSGSIVINITSDKQVTVDVYSNAYQGHFTCTGTLIDAFSTSPVFEADSPAGAGPVWKVSSEHAAGTTIVGTWQSADGADGGSGTFSASLISAAGVVLGGYMSGNWYDPSLGQSGHGFQLEFTDQADTAVAIWFVFSPDGSAQNWIYAQGTYNRESNSVTLPAVMLSGARFPPLFDQADEQQIDWGTLTFTFSSCDRGVASWKSNATGYGSGAVPIARLTRIAGTQCPQ